MITTICELRPGDKFKSSPDGKNVYEVLQSDALGGIAQITEQETNVLISVKPSELLWVDDKDKSSGSATAN